MFANMNSLYDEDLSQNPFFVELRGEHADLLQHCVIDGWILCIPRIGSLHTRIFMENDFLSHVLVPNEELPGTHYYSLTENSITVSNKVVSVQHKDTVIKIKILFEEIFYTEDNMKYKVWCVESPFNRSINLNVPNPTPYNTMVCLKECVEFLWTESGGKDVLENIDLITRCFKKKKINHDNIKLESLRNNVSLLYNDCLKIAFKNTKLNNSSKLCQNFMNNTRLAVETHMYHNIYSNVFDGIITCSAQDDSILNKIIRNLSDLQMNDLGINNKFIESIPNAKKHLSDIDSFSTILGKIMCIKNTIKCIKLKDDVTKNDCNIVNFLSADELLPVMIFLVLKSNISNWHAHLNFMKYFRFSIQSNHQFDESSYVISTLEAVIEHIKSKLLIGSCLSESQILYSCNNQENFEMIDMKKNNNTDDYTEVSIIDNIESLEFLFAQIKVSNYNKIKDILEKNYISSKNIIPDKTDKQANVSIEEILNDDGVKSPLKLCHPLCTCTNCCKVLSDSILITSPSVYSVDLHGFTALHMACIYGNPQIVDLLIEMGSNVNAIDYNGSAPLHYAASKGHQNALLLLLHAGANINIENMDKNSPLHLAANNGHDSCVKALIYFAENSRIKLNLDKENSNGNTPLHLSSKWGYVVITKFLLEYGADPWKNNSNGKNPIDLAHSNVILKILCSKNPFLSNYVNVVNFNKNTVEIIDSNLKSKLRLCDFNDVCYNCHEKEVKSSGIKPQTIEAIRQVERLFRAISYGDVKLACFYMNINIDNNVEQSVNSMNVSTNELCHPLCTCEQCKSVDQSFRMQPDQIYNINTCGLNGNTALHMSTQHGIIELCKILLDNNANIDIHNNKGQTALHIACQEGRISIIKLLLEHEANVNLKDVNGNTPLHLVCILGNLDIVKLLLDYGSNVHCLNASGKKPIDEAKEKMFPTIINLLKNVS